MNRKSPRRTRTGVLAFALAGVFVTASITVPAALADDVPEMGGRILSIQDAQAENQTVLDALEMVQGSGSQSQNVHTAWSDYQADGGDPIDVSFIEEMTDLLAGETSIKLRIDPIYICDRRTPADLVDEAWDDPDLIDRFEELLDEVYEAMNPISGPALDLDVLVIGTELAAALKMYPADSADKDYYLAYKTFFEAIRAHAKSLWGNSLEVTMAVTHHSLTSQDGAPNARTFTTATNAVSPGTTATFPAVPAGLVEGDYVTVDHNTANEEMRRITDISTSGGTTTFTFDTALTLSHSAGYSLVRTVANSLQALFTNADLVSYTYYGLDDYIRAAADPVYEPIADIYTAATFYYGRTVAILEAGYPTDPAIGGSEYNQALFIEAVFNAWDLFCDDSDCLNPTLKYVDFQWAHDWDPANVAHFTTPGCNETLAPRVKVTNTLAADATDTTITFSSAPGYLQNGDVIYLDDPFDGLEETAQIASGAGTTTLTLEDPLQFDHDAGFSVLWHGPTKPTATIVGTPGSSTYTYRMSAVNAVGETLSSPTVTVTNGPATQNGSNYVSLSWPSVPGATSYNVYRVASTGSPASLGFVVNQSGTTFVDNSSKTADPNHYNYTQNTWHFISSIGFREWEGSGTDKAGWGMLCYQMALRVDPDPANCD